MIPQFQQCFKDPNFDKNSFKANKRLFRDYDIDSSLCIYLISLPMRQRSYLLDIQITKYPNSHFCIYDPHTQSTTYSLDEHQAVWILIKLIYDIYKKTGIQE